MIVKVDCSRNTTAWILVMLAFATFLCVDFVLH